MKNYSHALQSPKDAHDLMLLMEHQTIQENLVEFSFMAALYGRGRGFRGRNQEMERYLGKWIPLNQERLAFEQNFAISASKSTVLDDTKAIWEKSLQIDTQIKNLLQDLSNAYGIKPKS